MSKITLQPNQIMQIVDDGRSVVVKNSEVNSGKPHPNPLLRGEGISPSSTEEGVGGSSLPEPLHIHVPADTTLEYFLRWEGKSIERQVVIHLDGEGAAAKLVGVFLGRDDLEFKLDSTMIHHAPNTYGNTLVKGALKDSSKAVLKGMIKIDKGANGSDDLLTERVLLLSPKARAEADPMLEIDANEVKATHAATISRINREQMYYLQTRGVDKSSAQEMIVEGFLDEVRTLMPV